MAGQGPNPAQTQYLQNVQNNVANTQGLISSQRGLNPALAAKLGSNAGATANQQAASGAAQLQQQQQLAATGLYGNLLGQEQQGNLAQQQLYVAPNTSAMQTNAAVANANQQAAQGITGGLLGSLGSALTVPSMASGGMVRNYDDGGGITEMPSGDIADDSNPAIASDVPIWQPKDANGTSGPGNPYNAGKNSNGAKSQVGQILGGFQGMGSQKQSGILNQGFGQLGALGGTSGNQLNQGIAALGESPSNSASNVGSSIGGLAAFFAKGGKVNAMVSPGEIYLPPSKAKAVAKGKESPMSGEHIKGKAKVPGDSLQNDTVPKKLKKGGVVIPRTKTAPDKAAQFVAAVLSKHGIRNK